MTALWVIAKMLDHNILYLPVGDTFRRASGAEGVRHRADVAVAYTCAETSSAVRTVFEQLITGKVLSLYC